HNIHATKKLGGLADSFGGRAGAKAPALAVGAHSARLRIGIVERSCEELHQTPAVRNVALHLGKLGPSQSGDSICSFDIGLPRLRGASVNDLLLEFDPYYAVDLQ